MRTNPKEDIISKDINHSVNRPFEATLLTPTEAQSLIKHAPDERSRLWFRLLHDTGLRRGQLLDLRKWDLRDHEGIDHVVVRLEDLDLDTLRPRIIVTQQAVSDDNIISPELGPRTARDLRGQSTRGHVLLRAFPIFPVHNRLFAFLRALATLRRSSRRFLLPETSTKSSLSRAMESMRYIPNPSPLLV